MSSRSHAIRLIVMGTVALGGLIFAAGSASAAQNLVLTAVQGDTSQAEGADGENLETGLDGGCSALLDRNAVVELCNDTRLSFRKHDRRGNRIVTVESGSVRLIVEPRAVNERIEIHTPAAIATILGTVVYVTVDPATGETTITSSESDINIRDRDQEDCTPRGLPPEAGVPECPEGKTIGALEQFHATPGEAGETKKLTPVQLDDIGGCLLDFHDVAVMVDRMSQESKAADRVAAVDAASVGNVLGLPVGREPPGDPGAGENPDPVEDPTETTSSVDDLMMEPPSGGCSAGIPGEHCP